MNIQFLFWRTTFRLTPAKWICEGCCNEQTNLRGKFGAWVTEQFGNAPDPT